MQDMTIGAGPTPAMTPEMQQMRTLGYSVIRDVIPRAEIERMKVAMRNHFRHAGRTQYGGRIQLRGFHAVPEVARLLLSERVAEVIRRHTPEGTVLLTGECDMMMNTASRWHKDVTPDMRMGDGIFGDRDFAVYKIAIYLQDQEVGSPAAFRVRPGTHIMKDGSAAPEQVLGVKAGDIVIFDVRIDHAGQPPGLVQRALNRPLRALSRVTGLDPDATMTRLRSALPGQGPDRLAVFMTFGPDAPATRAYEAAGRHRHGPAPAPLSHDAALALDRLGLEMIPVA